jgi:3-keto-disaccharide hydrolase
MTHFVRAAAVAAVLSASVASAPRAAFAQAVVADAGPWHSLFDGTSMDQWRAYRNEDVSGWHVVDGTITKDTITADIITREPYANFELELEWKISKGGNSGIFYRATEEYDHIYWSAPEYQLLDDANAPDGQNRLTAAGSVYAVYPSPAGVEKPAGEWNTTRIVVRGNHVEHWMNGKKLLEYELGSGDWAARVKASKFAAWADYGKAHIGYIGVQGDEEGSVSLRNIRIRELH